MAVTCIWWNFATLLLPFSYCCASVVNLLFLGKRVSSAFFFFLDYSNGFPLDTHLVVPAWCPPPQRWFFLGQPRTSRRARRCLPGLCRSVRPTPLEPCRSLSHRWRRSAVWLGHHPQHIRSSCSDQSLPPTGWMGRFIEKKYNVLHWIFRWWVI